MANGCRLMLNYARNYCIYLVWTEAMSGEKNESKVEKDTEVIVNEYTAGGTA